MVAVWGPEVVEPVVDSLDAVVVPGLVVARVCAVTNPVGGSHIRTRTVISAISLQHHRKDTYHCKNFISPFQTRILVNAIANVQRIGTVGGRSSSAEIK